jgi:hypothetical protein
LIVHAWTFRNENTFLPADFRLGEPTAPDFPCGGRDVTAGVPRRAAHGALTLRADGPGGRPAAFAVSSSAGHGNVREESPRRRRPLIGSRRGWRWPRGAPPPRCTRRAWPPQSFRSAAALRMGDLPPGGASLPGARRAGEPHTRMGRGQLLPPRLARPRVPRTGGGAGGRRGPTPSSSGC